MASGKETPRQKMINLMYLVFIAMLALNMSKEVLTTFGEIDEKVKSSTTNIKAKNSSDLEDLAKDAQTDASNWADAYEMVNTISSLANELDSYINSEIKFPIVVKEDKFDRNGDGNYNDFIPDYEVMDNSKEYDELFFDGDIFTSKGDSLVMLIDRFREGSITALDSLKEGIQPESVKDEIKALITEKFSTNNVIDGKGTEKPWLKYNFEHFPQIASTTKLTLMQENAQNIVARLIAAIRGETLTEITKANKQTAFAQGVNVFFTGEKLDGSVVLGKYDDNLFANRVIINGTPYEGKEVMENGQVNLEKLGIAVGNTPGEKSLKVSFEFDRFENKKDTTYIVEMDHKYAVVPNLANVSNPDMMVVYQDVENKLDISMAGVPDNQLTIISPKTITKISAGKYSMVKERGKNGKVDIVVGLKGSNITAKQTFEVIPLPDPLASLNKNAKKTKLPRKMIANGRITAAFADRRIANALQLKVKQFTVQIGAKTHTVKASKNGEFDKTSKNAILQLAKKGERITISNIRATSSKYAKKTFIPINVVSLTVID